MTDWDPDGTPDAPEYHGPDHVRSEADDTALYEFVEEAELPRRAWRRSAVMGALGGFAPENTEENTQVASAPLHDGSVWRTRWLAVAAGLAACVAITVAIVLKPASPTPTQSPERIAARTVPFVSTAVPYVPSQVRPFVAVTTSDRSAPMSRANVAPVAVPAPAPGVAVPPRPVETAATIPTAPSPVASSAPVVPPITSEPRSPSLGAEAAIRSPEPAAIAANAIEHDEREIRNLLDAYRDSYDRRDAVSAARLWPGVDTAALSRAFSTIASQQVDFEQCSLDVIGQRAKARCNGSLQYVRRIGNDSPKSRALSWDFELDRSTGRWLISRVTAQ